MSAFVIYLVTIFLLGALCAAAIRRAGRGTKAAKLALRRTTRELQDKSALAEDRKTERDVLLASMDQGFIAVDRDEQILEMNPAAERLLHLSAVGAHGRLLREVVRSTQLSQLVHQVIEADVFREGALQIHTGKESRYFEVRGMPSRGKAPESNGALLFFRDVWHLRRLENVRRDFVANVSHELRTPITSMKGFLETLLAGALENPQDSRRFVEIVLRQTNRLNDIVDDLLALARLESAEVVKELTREPIPMSELFRAALEICTPQAREKEIRLEQSCESGLMFEGNRLLIEQAVLNLVINAIKYSDRGGSVRLRTAHQNGTVSILVEDAGIGISGEHLPRIFERFYRVDKSRARQEGGSGLGLSIVKHIARVHGGDVSVESELGRGSTFALHLPA